MAANKALYDQWMADSTYNGLQTQGGQFAQGWTPNENGGWNYNGMNIGQGEMPTTGAYGERLTNAVRQQYGLPLDPNQMSAGQPRGWDTQRLGDFATFAPKGQANWTSLQDAIDDFQFQEASKQGQTIDRPWNKDAQAQQVGQAIVDAWNAKSGQHLSLDQLPVDQYAASLPSEHKAHDGIFQTAFPLLLGAAGGAIFGPAGEAASMGANASETAGLGGAAGGAGAAGAAGSTLPSNYWSMLADSGGAASDAAAAGAGTVGDAAAAGGAAGTVGATGATAGSSIADALALGGENAGVIGTGETSLSQLGTAAAAGGVGGSTTLDQILNYGKNLLSPSNLRSLVNVGGNLAAGALNSRAAGNAAQAQIDASQQAIAEQRRQFDLTRADNAPYQATGVAANSQLGSLLGVKGDPNAPGYGSLTKPFSASDLNADPVYNSGLQFGLDQGLKGVNARAVQQGGYDSGATLKAITNYANDYGSTKANDSFNRYNTQNTNVYNRLAGVSGTGQVANAQVASAGQNAANNVSQSLQDQGNSRAAGIVGGANAWGAAAQNINNNYNQQQQSQILQQLLANRGGTYQGPY